MGTVEGVFKSLGAYKSTRRAFASCLTLAKISLQGLFFDAKNVLQANCHK
jgi:hypothetical protein